MIKKTQKMIIAGLIVVVVIVTLFLIFDSFLTQHEATPYVPSVYHIGAVAPFFSHPTRVSLHDSANKSYTITVNINAANVTVLTLGVKPLLRIENMDVRGCMHASVYIAKHVPLRVTNSDAASINDNAPYDDSAFGSDWISVGAVRYSTGNTNYEIPYGLNYTQYPFTIVWCDSINASLGIAHFE